MQALARTRYGPPDVLRLVDVPAPELGRTDVLVRVRAAALNAADRLLLRGTPPPVRLMSGLLRPKHAVLGADVAGVVEAVGPDVRGFAPGDEVFGCLSECGFGGFAERARGPEAAFARRPARASWEEAAALPMAGMTALQALRDAGRLASGQRVLVHGASGGVGTFAVQLAKALGAGEVTAVARASAHGLLRGLGADRCLDRARDDAAREASRYDLVIEAAGFRSPRRWTPALAPGGTCVFVGGSMTRLAQATLLGPWVRRTSGRRLVGFLSTPRTDDLQALAELVDAGALRPVIDRVVGLADVPDALRALEAGGVLGKIVARI